MKKKDSTTSQEVLHLFLLSFLWEYVPDLSFLHILIAPYQEGLLSNISDYRCQKVTAFISSCMVLTHNTVLSDISSSCSEFYPISESYLISEFSPIISTAQNCSQGYLADMEDNPPSQ